MADSRRVWSSVERNNHYRWRKKNELQSWTRRLVNCWFTKILIFSWKKQPSSMKKRKIVSLELEDYLWADSGRFWSSVDRNNHYRWRKGWLAVLNSKIIYWLIQEDFDLQLIEITIIDEEKNDWQSWTRRLLIGRFTKILIFSWKK